MIEIPGYTLLRQIGQGGMASVYLAEQQSLGREVALKVLAPQLAQDADARERFLREARTAAKLHHPHIVPIYDVGTHGDLAYIAMEYEPGGTAMPVVGAGHELNAALGVVRQIATALDHAHSQGVVHRDIKPENILCRADGTCMLSDFGIARAMESNTVLTREGSTVGTPQYMSPEQLRGEKLDGRADLYSLGVMLYQLLTGKLPYTGSDGWAVGMQHLTAEIPRLPPGLAKAQPLLDRMMAKLPADRPRSGAAVVQEIDALLAGAPATVPMPVSAPAGQGRFAKGPWLVGGAVALLALGAFAVWKVHGGEPAAAPAVAAPGPAVPAPASPAPAIKSVAVLPFVNMSSDKENEYFADGISEEILNQLAQLKNLRVAGRTSSFSFKGKDQDLREIGRQLGVAYVLEGSVRKSDTNVRITAQLIQARDGFHVWSQTYDRELSDIFKVQDEISRAVLDAMKANLLGDQQPRASSTTSVAAYNLHLQAQSNFFKRGSENLEAARRQFEAALALDPDYVPSLVGLARTLVFMPSYKRYVARERDALFDASAEAARRALALDADNAAAHALLAYGAMKRHRWEEAEAGFTRALALAPNDGEVVNMAGDFYVQVLDRGRALELERRALELNPLSPVHNWEVGIAHAVFGEFDRAIPHLTAGNALAPELFRPYFSMVWSYGELKRFDEMHAVIAKARRLTQAPDHYYLFLDAWAAIFEGKRERALQLLERLEPVAARGEIGPPSWLGYAYLLVGESDKAAHWLQQASSIGDDSFGYPDPIDLKRLYADPKTRFVFRDPDLKALLDIQARHLD